jgi:membrane protein implicated in regulation of membrane protease activity
VHFTVPQFIDVEDKVAFQLTVKQLGWFALGGVILFIIWKFVVPVVFYIWVVIIALLACVFAFYKPYGIPFHQFLLSAVKYLVKPKVLVWDRKGIHKREEKKVVKKKEENKVDYYMKEKQLKRASELAKILDKNSKI